MKNSEHNINSKKDGEMLKYVKPVWEKRKTVFVILFLSACLGVFVALKAEKVYTASTVFIPQISGSDGIGNLGGSIGGLASLAGIDLQKSVGKEFPPSLYPDILRSVEVQLQLLEAPLILPGTNVQVTFRQYYEDYHKESFMGVVQKYTLGLPGMILKALKGSGTDENATEFGDFTRLSTQEYQLIQRMQSQISIIPSVREGFVSISVSMPDPYLAAQMTKNLEKLLREELTRYKITNAKAELDYIQERYNEKESGYLGAQESLAVFRDRNKNLNTASSRNKLDQLQSEYDLAQDIYLNLARQREQAKLQLTRDTPVFSVIKPISVPTLKSGPNSVSTVLLFIFLGIMMSAGVVFLPGIYADLKYRLKS